MTETYLYIYINYRMCIIFPISKPILPSGMLAQNDTIFFVLSSVTSS